MSLGYDTRVQLDLDTLFEYSMGLVISIIGPPRSN